MQDLGGGLLGQGFMTSLCSFNRATTFMMKMFMANMKYEYQKGRQIIGVDLHVHDIHNNAIFLFLVKCVHRSFVL